MRTAFLTLSTIVAFLIPGPAHAQASAAAPGVRGVLPRVQSVGPYQKSSIERLLRGTITPVDSLDVIVFLVSFADREFNTDHDMVFFENELRHLREYYAGASRNVFHPRTTIYPTIVELSGNEGYYGADGLWKERMAELLIEVVQKTDASVDFSRYDAFAVIHAGAGRETDFNNDSRYQIPSGFVNPVEMAEALKDTLGTPGVPTNDLVDGSVFQIDNLMVWPEEASQDGYIFGSLGIYAYQMGLRLGMAPLYDTTPEDYPDSQGIGNFDLMSYGIYNALGFVPAFPSAFNRYLMGWVEPVVVEGDLAVRLADVNSTGALDTTLVKIPINASEYFLVENRVHDTNFSGRFDFIDADSNGVPSNPDTLLGAEFDFFLTATTNLRPDPVNAPDSVITGSGLMIYHVDEAALRRALETGRYPNDDKTWKGVDLEEADHVQDLDSPVGAFAYGSFYDSFRRGNNDRFGPDTDPSSADNAGAPTGIEVSEISDAGHYMTFTASFSPPIDFVRSELAGNASKLSPIPVDLDGDGVEDLVSAADTGLVYIVRGAGLSGWTGHEYQVIEVEGALWTAPPVIGWVFATLPPGIFITSRGGYLHAFDRSGAALAIDDDVTPGTLQLRGDRASSLILEQLDDDGLLDLVAVSSTADSTFLCILGLDISRPDPWWTKKGFSGIEFGVLDGRIASHPVWCRVAEGVQGIYLATYGSGGSLRFHFIPLGLDWAVASLPKAVLLGQMSVEREMSDLITPAAGDIDNDGIDELVAVVPGSGLYYFEPGDQHSEPGELARASRLRGANPSPPVLADVDGDGTLETALRDDEYLYLFSGFGTPARGWPKKLDEASAARDRSAPQSPPVIADINGDGAREIVFRVSGDLRAFDFSGREIEGWPLPGEGVAGGSIALLKGEAGRLYVFDCASSASYARDDGGTQSGDAVVSLRRYDLGVAYQDNQAWPFYRHDARGTGRQLPSGESSPRERVDPATFIVYPNPVTGGSFVARVLVSAPARVKVTAFNIEGEKVVERTLEHSWFAGSAVPFETGFSTAAFSGGVYICRIEVTGDGWSWTGAKKFAVIR